MKQLYIILFLFIFLILLQAVKAQQQYLPLNNSINDIVESQLLKKEKDFHSSIRPYKMSEVNKLINLDSIYRSLNIKTKSGLIYGLMNGDSSVDNDSKHKNSISATALLLGEGAYDFKNKEKALYSGAGFNISCDLGKKLSFSANVFFNNSEYFNYADSVIKRSNVIPGEGKAINSQLGYFYRTFTFYAVYSPSKFFSFGAGKGKNFWGDGYRSLLLSDNSNSYPYFKITTTLGKFKYVNLFANLRNVDAPDIGIKEANERYTAMHYLSWDIAKWCNISFFEAVMFNGKDTTGRRGFDINYLNPVIFYRPVEYSVGSPDNELLGANISFRVNRKNKIYSQIMLDEFLLNHIRAHDGWWANKQGFQIGLKSFDVFSIKNLNFQTEYNYVRPYTYTHFDITSNYSNYNQSLAVPLGANFMESVTMLHYRVKRWQYQLKYNFAVYGADQYGINYGQNIFATDEFLVSFKRQLNNYVGQGLKNKLQYKEFNVSYTINSKADLVIEAGIINRTQDNNLFSRTGNFIYFGIKTLFDNQYFDF